MLQEKQNTEQLIEEPPRDLRDGLAENIGDISMLPEVATEAMLLCNDVECTPERLSKVIGKDVFLSTEMLAFANCSMYANGTTITNLNDAIVRLGLRKCSNLIVASGTASLLNKMPLETAWVRDILWEHSFLTARVASILNKTLRLRFQGEEFSAGLLHDFGRLLLAVSVGERFSVADPLSFGDEADALKKEFEVLGTDHCRYGAWLAHVSGLPTCLIDVIRWHHHDAVPLESAESEPLIRLVAAADHIANNLQIDFCLAEYNPETNVGLRKLGVIFNRDFVGEFPAVAEVLMQELSQDGNA